MGKIVKKRKIASSVCVSTCSWVPEHLIPQEQQTGRDLVDRYWEKTDTTMRRFDPQLYRAVLWLREHQDLFTDKIHEPIITQINVKDGKTACYLQSIIPFQHMKSFLCQNEDDRTLFLNKVCVELDLKVNIICHPLVDTSGTLISSKEYLPNNPLVNIKQYGFKSYLADLYDAPKAVHRFLCEKYNLHNIPVGGKQVIIFFSILTILIDEDQRERKSK